MGTVTSEIVGDDDGILSIAYKFNGDSLATAAANETATEEAMKVMGGVTVWTEIRQM